MAAAGSAAAAGLAADAGLADSAPGAGAGVAGESRTSDLEGADRDFDGHPRSDTTRGAYEAGLADWQLGLDNR